MGVVYVLKFVVGIVVVDIVVDEVEVDIWTLPLLKQANLELNIDFWSVQSVVLSEYLSPQQVPITTKPSM